MLKYSVKRIFQMIPMLLLITLIVFALVQSMPGDPISARFSPEEIAGMTTEQLAELREEAGLNDPFLVQYFGWLSRSLKGDFGYSTQTGTSINMIIKNLLPATIKLSFAALILSVVVGLFFGILSAVKRNTFIDYLASTLGIIGISLPEFFVGIILLLVFAIKLRWFPAQGRTDIGANFFQNLKYVFLPALSLGVTLAAALTRYTRNSMLDVMGKSYVKTARAKGLSEWKIFYRHVFRNALMPIMVLIVLRLPLLIGGSVVIEQVFGYSGIGSRLLTAINSNDYQLVLIIIFLLSVVSLISSLLIDIFTGLLDPRIRIK